MINLNNIFLFATSFPGMDAIEKMEKEGTAASTANNAIDFFVSNKDYLSSIKSIWVIFMGVVQNALYNVLYWIANLVFKLVEAGLWLFEYIPAQILELGSKLNILLEIVYTLAGGLITVALMTFLIHYLFGSKQHNLAQTIQSIGINILMMILIPFITFTVGKIITDYISPAISGNNKGSSLAKGPLISNTVDLQTWALTGFENKPFTAAAGDLNNLAERPNDRFVPDYSMVMNERQILTTNELAESGAFITISGGPTVKTNTNITNVGNVFLYVVEESGFSEYKIIKTEPKFKLSTMMSVLLDTTTYKRYKTQNIPAISAYIILIFMGLCLAIKVARTAFSCYINMFAGIIAAARDVSHTNHTREILMRSINSGLAVALDIIFLLLFLDLSVTLPNAARMTLAPNNPILGSLIYVLSLAVFALAIYNGSSVLEKSFGVTSSAKAQTGILKGLAAPGVMLGAALGSMFGGRIANARNEKKALAKAGDKPKEDPEQITNHGAGAAEQLRGGSSEPDNGKPSADSSNSTTQSSGGGTPPANGTSASGGGAGAGVTPVSGNPPASAGTANVGAPKKKQASTTTPATPGANGTKSPTSTPTPASPADAPLNNTGAPAPGVSTPNAQASTPSVPAPAASQPEPISTGAALNNPSNIGNGGGEEVGSTPSNEGGTNETPDEPEMNNDDGYSGGGNVNATPATPDDVMAKLGAMEKKQAFRGEKQAYDNKLKASRLEVQQKYAQKKQHRSKQWERGKKMLRDLDAGDPHPIKDVDNRPRHDDY